MSVKDLIGDVRDFAEKALGEDREKYEEALKQGVDALSKAKDLFAAMQRGDKEAVEVLLTEWEDVNRTLEAIGKMDAAIEDAENGISLGDVLEVVGKVAKVVATLGALAV